MLVAANVAVAEYGPPANTAAQALYVASQQLNLSGDILGTFHAEVSQEGGSWRVRLYDASPEHAGGPGGEVVIDRKSGKILSRVFYR